MKIILDLTFYKIGHFGLYRPADKFLLFPVYHPHPLSLTDPELRDGWLADLPGNIIMVLCNLTSVCLLYSLMKLLQNNKIKQDLPFQAGIVWTAENGVFPFIIAKDVWLDFANGREDWVYQVIQKMSFLVRICLKGKKEKAKQNKKVLGESCPDDILFAFGKILQYREGSPRRTLHNLSTKGMIAPQGQGHR